MNSFYLAFGNVPSLLWNLIKVPFNERMSSRLGLLFTSSSKAPNGHWGTCAIDKFYLPSMKGPGKVCVCVNLCVPACISMYFHLLSCILLFKSYERLTISRSTYINCSSWNRDSMLNLYEVKKAQVKAHITTWKCQTTITTSLLYWTRIFAGFCQSHCSLCLQLLVR